ncbi:DUF4190 domain-containing protein [Pseudogracilibacillus auburnensis]|uniref:Uncharacterized protein DUF4190 n=1 Tax=Pseudogracilibacillus auburnensis TaxID=1494959 RepID=A0A2V3WGX3_9BACI|nr:DUF4190 domain-containing protein [Pseudogracilibacillus auburnensis]MBO1004871.1 DUF4190 domain-containing protein [Pseudogracilibacillus auburnensis]PXW88059.1 uncharacterized protein DUF4190 [Pseudogracilibacillus auburnensis]
MENEVKTNSNAILSLVLGALALTIPFVGFITGIIGIIISLKATKQIKATNENGQGVATAGLVCSIVGLVLQLFAIIAFLLFMLLIFVDTMTYY